MKTWTVRAVRVGVLVPLMAAVSAAATGAQDGWDERITILVPNLAPAEGLRDRFGTRVASELRSLIDALQTHQTVGDRDLRNALRQYDLSQRDLYDCIRARQLATQRDWGLVLCGRYEGAGGGQVRVTASFVGARTGEAFDVEPFTINERDHRQAAERILETFDRWQTQLRHTVFCSQYLDTRQWDLALTNCEQALAINPASGAARYLLAHVFWRTDRPTEALGALDTVLDADPMHEDALKLAGIVATELGDRQLARRYLDRYMAQNPADVRVRLTIATEIANAGDPEGALRFAELGIEAEPDNLNLITYIGHYAINAALKAEAGLTTGNGVAAEPDRVTALYQTAAESYEKVFAVSGEATEPEVLERLVVALVKLGRLEQAMDVGRRATEAVPDNAGIWDAYSRALEEARRIPEALDALARAERLGKAGPGSAQRAALMHLRAGSAADAIRTLRSAVDRGLVESHDAWRVVFGYAYNERFRAGQHAEAYRILEQAGPLAVGEADRLARAFWMGYSLYEQALVAEAPQTAESARRALPMFERALELFESARGYEQFERSAPVPRLIENARRYIEIQKALIRRGR